MQVLGCSALQSIDDGDAKETTDSLPSLCVCSAPLPHTHTHTHTHMRAPALPSPAHVFIWPSTWPYQRQAPPAARLPANRCLEPPPFVDTIYPHHNYS